MKMYVIFKTEFDKIKSGYYYTNLHKWRFVKKGVNKDITIYSDDGYNYYIIKPENIIAKYKNISSLKTKYPQYFI